VLPVTFMQLAAGLAFLLFAFLMLRSGGGGRSQSRLPLSLPPVVLVAASFFLAELGDKTQLTTLTLAGQQPQQAVLVWTGGVLGLLTANAFAIAAGRLLGARLPQRALRRGAALVFAAVGFITLAVAVSQVTGWCTY